MPKYIWFTVIISLVIPSLAFGEELNAGIVAGLWYSDEPVYVTDTIRVYVAVRNNTDGDLTGTVTFYDNDDRFGSQQISALDGRIIEAWADWTPTYGEHTLRATLSRVKHSVVGGEEEWIEVVSALSEDTLFVDFDTDGDDIGDQIDSDDDNDGVNDADEIARGTDPLVADDPEPDLDDHPAPDDNEETENKTPDQSETNSPPVGLEEYLAPSRARSAFVSITETVNQARENLDNYRTQRSNSDNNHQNNDLSADDVTTTSATNTASSTSGSGVGTITRSGGTDTGGWFATLTNWANHVANLFYTAILYLLSLYLAHPALVQLTLLLLLLYLVYKLAKTLGRRPS